MSRNAHMSKNAKNFKVRMKKFPKIQKKMLISTSTILRSRLWPTHTWVWWFFPTAVPYFHRLTFEKRASYARKLRKNDTTRVPAEKLHATTPALSKKIIALQRRAPRSSLLLQTHKINASTSDVAVTTRILPDATNSQPQPPLPRFRHPEATGALVENFGTFPT